MSTSAYDFEVWHTAPTEANGWALLGDLSKWVPVAAVRFDPVVVSDAALSVTVHGGFLTPAIAVLCSLFPCHAGAPGEIVDVTFANGVLPVTVKCVFGTMGGSLIASVPAAHCQ